jgi:hypothetical protein
MSGRTQERAPTSVAANIDKVAKVEDDGTTPFDRDLIVRQSLRR